MVRIESYENLGRLLAGYLRRQQALLVGVDGPGGSGKSTFAGALALALNELKIPARVVHMDDFYRPSSERPVGGAASELAGGDFDWERLRDQVLVPLSQDRPASYQRYDWTADALAEWHDLPAGGAVIVEGIYSLRPELAGFFDYRIFVEAPYSQRLERGVERDGEAARSTWEGYWMPSEQRYFDLHHPQEQADLWVDGSRQASIDPTREFAVIR